VTVVEPDVQTSRIPWEIQEIVAAGLFLCLVILAVTGIVGSWAQSIQTANYHFTQGWQVFVASGTEWADLFIGFLLVSILGLVWWQVDGWTDQLTGIDNVEGSDETVTQWEADEAVGHIARNRSLVTLLIVFCIVVSISTVVWAVAEVTPYNGSPTSQIIARTLLVGGQSLTTLVLSVIAFVGGIVIHRRCDDALGIESDPV